MTPDGAIAEARQQEYVLQLQVNRLREQVREHPGAAGALCERLAEAEAALANAEARLTAGGEPAPGHAGSSPAGSVGGALPETGRIVDTNKKSQYLSVETTGLDVQVNLRMPYVPTAFYHLLNRADTPLISCRVRNGSSVDKTLRVRVISFIEGFSAQAVETVELKKNNSWSFDQLPTLLPDRVRDLNEMTRVTLNIMVENLDGQIELHKTEPIWLMARTTALFTYWDPTLEKSRDLTSYLGAFVTPNAPDVMSFLRQAAGGAPDGQFLSYFGDAANVEAQVKAIFQALKARGLTYTNSWFSFGPDRRSQFHQRVRLPRESLKDREANCIDGAVLFASLLEAVSLSAALVLLPGHAFVAWETACDANGAGSDRWCFLETTMIGSKSFDEARASAEEQYARYAVAAQLLKLRELRSRGVVPLE